MTSLLYDVLFVYLPFCGEQRVWKEEETMPTVIHHSEGSQPSISSESVLEEANDYNELRPLSCFSFILFLCNAFVIVGIDQIGLFSIPTTRAISERYQTLITPVFWVAPVVWAVQLLSQGVWAVAQLLPAYRNSPLAKDGIHRYYIGVVLSQLIWIFSFSYEIVYVSLLSGLSNFAFLCLIMHDQNEINPSTSEHWIFEFPFSLFICRVDRRCRALEYKCGLGLLSSVRDSPVFCCKRICGCYGSGVGLGKSCMLQLYCLYCPCLLHGT